MAENIYHRKDDESESDNSMAPVYRSLSLKNGKINKMTKEQIKHKLAQLKLDTRGVKEVLKKRLKNFYKKREMMKAKIRPPGICRYDYLAVIDFEATCQEQNHPHFKHEIIEFPIVLVDTKERKIVNEFHAYVKPVMNPKLSDFCTELTGITQDQVTKCDTFPMVLNRVEEWMKCHNLGKKGAKFAVLTDGPWDMARFLHIQCLTSHLAFPKWARKWVNIRKAFSNFYGFPRSKLVVMLENMGMTFEGHQHSGIDDSRNIARIAIRMLEDGCDIQINERIFADKLAKHTLDLVDIESIRKEDSHNLEDSSEDECDKFTDCLEVAESLSQLTIKENNNQLPKNKLRRDSYNENIDDLLSYYALQKS